MSEEIKTIQPAPMCANHRSVLVHDAKFLMKDPWQILEVCATVALIQAATASEELHKRIGDDLAKIDTIGCLACFCPKEFSHIVEIAKKNKKIDKFAPLIKEYGESFVLNGKKLILRESE